MHSRLLGSLIISLFLVAPSVSHAATFVWDGGGSDDNWSTAANWNPNVVPRSTGSVVFNGTSSDNVLIDINARVLSINIGPGYTGTITQSGTLMVGTGGFIQGGGTFTGGNVPIVIQGSLTLTGGTLLSTSSVLSLSGALLKTGGTFTHNSGTVSLASHAPRSVSGSLTFHRLDVESTKETGLVGYWKLDETSIPTYSCTASATGGCTMGTTGQYRTAADSSGNGWDASGPSTSWVASTSWPTHNAFGAPVDFPNAGSMEFYDNRSWLANRSGPEVGTTGTISFWFKLTQNSGLDFAISTFTVGPSSQQTYFLYSLTGARWGGTTCDGTSATAARSAAIAAISDGNWHNITLTRALIGDGSRAQCISYIDGNVNSALTETGSLSMGKGVMMGNFSASDGLGMRGALDDVRIYNRALSASEVADLVSGIYPTRTGGSTLTANSALTVTNTLNVWNGTFALAANTLTAAGATIQNQGQVTTSGNGIKRASSIALSPASPVLGQAITLIVTDPDENLDGTTAETATASLEGEAVTLTETAVDSGVFAGTITTRHGSVVLGNGIFERDDGCSFSVVASYGDIEDSTDVITTSGLVTDPQAQNCGGSTETSGGGGGGGGGHRQAAPVITRFDHASSSSNATEPEDEMDEETDAETPSTPERTPTTRAFPDVPKDAWFSGAISMLKDLGIAKGYEDGLFRPTNEVTTAEALTLLLRAAKIDLVTGPSLNTSAQGSWAQQYIATGESMGLPGLEGNVHTPATRGMIFRMMTQIFAYPLSSEPHPFVDLPASHPATSAIQTLHALGIVRGDDGTGTVRPDGLINRAELSVLLMRVVE